MVDPVQWKGNMLTLAALEAVDGVLAVVVADVDLALLSDQGNNSSMYLLVRFHEQFLRDIEIGTLRRLYIVEG